MDKQLIQLAANVGIDARYKTVKQIKVEYDKIKHPSFSDQHDMRFIDYVKTLKE